MAKEKREFVVLALVLVIVVLAGVVSYLLLIRPAISGFVTSQQNAGAQYGVQYTVLSIAQQAATCKTVTLPVGNETMDLIWVKCLQQAQPAQ